MFLSSPPPASPKRFRGYGLPLLVAVAVALPSLGFGFLIDDYMFLVSIEGGIPDTHPLGVYKFAPGDPEQLQPMLDTGPMPWFTLPDLKLHFCRPLTVATMYLDHAIFGRHAAGYHFQSLLWYLALAAAGMLVLRRSLPGSLGVLALLLFVLDEGHLLPVHWWSNRHAMVAAAPAFLGLAAHLRWREEGWKPGFSLSLLGYAVGFAGGETAMAVLAYFAAYELFAAPGTLRKRIAELLPGAGLAALYLLVYKALGYGVHGSGVYVDPVAEPWAYLRSAPGRFLELTAAQIFALPSEASTVDPNAFYPLVAGGIAALLVMAVLLHRLWPNLTVEERRGLRWLLPGAMLSALPALATFPSARLLLVPSFGASAGVAVIIRHAWRRRHHAPGSLRVASRAAGVFGVLFIVIHLILPPLHFIGSPIAAQFLNRGMIEITETAELDWERLPNQHVLVMNAADPAAGMYPLLFMFYLHLPAPLSWRTVTFMPHELRVARTGPKRLEVETLDDELLVSDVEQLVRSLEYPLVPGARVEMQGFDITILACGKRGPTRLALDFDAPLDDPAQCFLVWRDLRLYRFTPPAEGESVILPRQPGVLNGEFWKERWKKQHETAAS